jgi:hypothetical protein
MQKLATVILAVALAVIASSASAECMKNRSGDVVCGRGQCEKTRDGQVFCSRYEDGAAVRTSEGKVVCGKGQCVKTSRGEIFCSADEGGSAMKDRNGDPKCLGECERASIENCEGEPPGSP